MPCPFCRQSFGHCFNLVDIGGGPSWAYPRHQWARCVASGHAAGHQAHEVEGSRLGLQSPCQAGPGPERPNQPRPVGGGRPLGVPLAAHQFVPAFHEVPQPHPHLRRQAHPALPPTGSPPDRVCAIVGYRRARNAAARRAHAQRRRRYCEDLFRQYEVSLHHQVVTTDPLPPRSGSSCRMNRRRPR